MKALKRGLALLLVIPMIVGVMAVAKPAEASSSDLADLIVLDGLFGLGDAEDLAGLIAVDSITGGGSFDGGNSDLSELIVLGGLFGGWGSNAEDLAGLIAVDNIF